MQVDHDGTHDARRIDNQLRGRSGRQGDPGETQFYVSMEDDLMRIFAGDFVKFREFGPRHNRGAGFGSAGFARTRAQSEDEIKKSAEFKAKRLETKWVIFDGVHSFGLRALSRAPLPTNGGHPGNLRILRSLRGLRIHSHLSAVRRQETIENSFSSGYSGVTEW